MNTSQIWVVDFKTRQTPLLFKRLFYAEEHADLNCHRKKSKTTSYLTGWKHKIIHHTVRMNI